MRADETSIELSAPATHLVRLAHEELGHMSVRRRAEGFVELHTRRSPRKRGTRFLSIAVVLAFGAVVLVARWPTRQHGGLSFAVDGGRLDPTGTVEADGPREPILRFSDGTQVIFLAGARGHVRSVDEHGARVALDGRSMVEVVHWRGSHWLFDVGPYLITVKGTAFTAEWNDTEKRLEVVLKTGTVAVSGPLSDEAITLRAGQRLIISVRDKEVVIRDSDASGEMGDATSVPPLPSTEDVDGRPSLHVEAPPPATPAHRAVDYSRIDHLPRHDRRSVTADVCGHGPQA
jgi:ferric-dicitrate binding protein FerR (iron transport regulator)